MNTLTILVIIAIVPTQAFGFNFHPRLDGRIVGGEDADKKDFYYQVSLQYYGSHFCGGSILSDKVVLTAAHCTDGLSASTLTVRAGSSIKESGGQVVGVAQVGQHSQYDSSTNDFDVSVLLLSEPITQGSSVNIQPLGQEVAVGKEAVVTGWGALYSGGGSPSNLQKVSVARVDPIACNNVYYYYITYNLI